MSRRGWQGQSDLLADDPCLFQEITASKGSTSSSDGKVSILYFEYGEGVKNNAVGERLHGDCESTGS